MATAACLLSEAQLLCPICLDLFHQPVSTPCGHNFCRNCIHGYWKSAHLSRCPVCKETFHRRLKLSVNTFISLVVAQFETSVEKKGEDEDRASSHKEESSADVWTGKRVRALRSCPDCETHLDPRHAKKRPTMKTQDKVCEKHEKLPGPFCHTDQVSACWIGADKDHWDRHTAPEGQDKRAHFGRAKAEVEKEIHGRLQTISEITQSVEVSRGNKEREVDETLQIFSKLLHFIQRGRDEALEEIGAKQTQVESRAGGLIRELEQEIEDLTERGGELEQSSTPPASSDPTDVRLPSAVYVGTARRAVMRVACQLEETAKAEVRRLCTTELWRAQRCAVDVTLDPDTAHPKLVLSDDGKRVHHGDVALRPPDDPLRFYPGVSVLGKEGFSSGRFYFEVQVKGKTEWDVGVGLEWVNRKGGAILNPENGYWALGLRPDKGYWALSSAPVCVPLVERPQRVGVYVDLEWGQVSFYNVDSVSHIYSFTGHSFGGRLFPYFNPRRNHDGINSAPLIISPVSEPSACGLVGSVINGPAESVSVQGKVNFA